MFSYEFFGSISHAQCSLQNSLAHQISNNNNSKTCIKIYKYNKNHVFDKALQMHRSSPSSPFLVLDTTDWKGREPETISNMLR